MWSRQAAENADRAAADAGHGGEQGRPDQPPRQRGPAKIRRRAEAAARSASIWPLPSPGTRGPGAVCRKPEPDDGIDHRPVVHLQPRYTLADTAQALAGPPKGLPQGPDTAGREVS
ncbi:hypothetical protein ACWDA9_38920 [Streptomyces sp. NPDC001193]